MTYLEEQYFVLCKDMDRLRAEKSLVFDDLCNAPCTADLEVKLKKLISYFEKRARENEKRASKCASRCEENSGYYFSGKADSYRRAAEKLKELLGG